MARKTDIQTALNTPLLTPFEGRETVETAVELPGAAGGLRDALQLAPEEWPQGTKLYLLFEVEVTKVRFQPTKDRGDVNTRVHVCGQIDAATVVDGEAVKRFTDDHKEKVRLRDEALAGIQRLDWQGDLADMAEEDRQAFLLSQEQRALAEEAASAEGDADRQPEEDPGPGDDEDYEGPETTAVLDDDGYFDPAVDAALGLTAQGSNVRNIRHLPAAGV